MNKRRYNQMNQIEILNVNHVCERPRIPSRKLVFVPKKNSFGLGVSEELPFP